MPATAVGLVFASLALLRGRTVIVNGVVEAHGPLLRWALSRLIPNRGGASAITLGHVVLGCDAVRLESTRVHERVHVEQYERWGPLFDVNEKFTVPLPFPLAPEVMLTKFGPLAGLLAVQAQPPGAVTFTLPEPLLEEKV